jgi:hypothetical protein
MSIAFRCILLKKPGILLVNQRSKWTSNLASNQKINNQVGFWIRKILVINLREGDNPLKQQSVRQTSMGFSVKLFQFHQQRQSPLPLSPSPTPSLTTIQKIHFSFPFQELFLSSFLYMARWMSHWKFLFFSFIARCSGWKNPQKKKRKTFQRFSRSLHVVVVVGGAILFGPFRFII